MLYTYLFSTIYSAQKSILPKETNLNYLLRYYIAIHLIPCTLPQSSAYPKFSTELFGLHQRNGVHLSALSHVTAGHMVVGWYPRHEGAGDGHLPCWDLGGASWYMLSSLTPSWTWINQTDSLSSILMVSMETWYDGQVKVLGCQMQYYPSLIKLSLLYLQKVP